MFNRPEYTYGHTYMYMRLDNKILSLYVRTYFTSWPKKWTDDIECIRNANKN